MHILEEDAFSHTSVHNQHGGDSPYRPHVLDSNGDAHPLQPTILSAYVPVELDGLVSTTIKCRYPPHVPIPPLQARRVFYGEGEQDSNVSKAWEERDVRRSELFEKGQSKRIWGELYKVIR